MADEHRRLPRAAVGLQKADCRVCITLLGVYVGNSMLGPGGISWAPVGHAREKKQRRKSNCGLRFQLGPTTNARREIGATTVPLTQDGSPDSVNASGGKAEVPRHNEGDAKDLDDLGRPKKQDIPH